MIADLYRRSETKVRIASWNIDVSEFNLVSLKYPHAVDRRIRKMQGLTEGVVGIHGDLVLDGIPD